MQILVRQIDLSTPQTISGSSAAYWISFDCELAMGRALLVPAAGGVQRGQSISVETDQETVSQFHVLATGEQQQARLLSLDEAGSYALTGKVATVIAPGADGQPRILDIAVDACYFTLTEEEIREDSVSRGDWVKFVVHRMSLWDEGL